MNTPRVPADTPAAPAPGDPDARDPSPGGFLGRLRLVLDMIQFAHTLFALPFAMLALMLAARDASPPGWPGWRVFLLVLACMVGARSAAMAYNRLADRDVDAANPRTAGRALPAGRLSPAWVGLFTLAAGALFVACAFGLNPLAGWLSLPALAWILAYSHTKRFLAGSHFWLGISLAIAPIGAWVAVTGALAGAPWLLALAVALWVAGFDLVYACQDADFDRAAGLASLSARLGPRRALRLAALCHAGMIAALVAFAVRQELGIPFRGGLVLASLLLLWEHRVVRGGDLGRIDLAFFRINSAVGVLLFLAGAADLLLAAR